MRVVIIGGGVAGTTAAEVLRKEQPNAEITLISEELHPLYSRVLLPHFLKKKVPRERVFLKKESWYGEQDIEWMRGVRVTQIDTKNAFVRTSEEREIPYDKLLITTGGDARSLETDARGVSYLRTLDDADHLWELLHEQEHTHGFVYGGGFMACEYINLFAHYGFKTTVAHRGPYFWSRILDEASGTLIHDHISAAGVTVLGQKSFDGWIGEKKLEAARIGEEEYPCSIAGVGVGMVCDQRLLQEAGLEVRSGLVANHLLETSTEHVYTAGDIAEFYDDITGAHLHVGNWMNAMSQGRCVAKTIAGTPTTFSLVSSYATNALGLEIIFIGDTHRDRADEILVRGSKEDGGVSQIFLRCGRVVGATLVGRNEDRPPLTKLIKEQVDVSSHYKNWSSIDTPISL